MEIQGRGANSSCCCGCVHARKSAGSKCGTWQKVSCPDSVFSRKSEMKAAPNPLSGQCRPWGTWVRAARSWRWMQHTALPAEHQPALFVTSASHRTDFALSWTVFQWKHNSSQETFDAMLNVCASSAKMLTSELLMCHIFIQWMDKNCQLVSPLPSAIAQCGFFYFFLQQWCVTLNCANNTHQIDGHAT